MHDDANNLEEKPLDPAVERVRRKLMRLMLGSVAITMILILTVLAAVIYKIMAPEANEVANDAISKTSIIEPVLIESAIPTIGENRIEKSLALPKGAKIVAHSLSGSYLSLQILTPEQTTEFLIYDFIAGKFIAKINMKDQ